MDPVILGDPWWKGPSMVLLWSKLVLFFHRPFEDIQIKMYGLVWGQSDFWFRSNKLLKYCGFALPQNIFSRRSPITLRLLNEDNVHFRLLTWLPDCQNQRIVSSTNFRMIPKPPSQQSPPQPPPRNCSMTRKRSRTSTLIMIPINFWQIMTHLNKQKTFF